ncbi:MAG: LamG-like jellyroll fold domain-containing protein [Pirellulales bacterium]
MQLHHLILFLLLTLLPFGSAHAADEELVGYWKLQGDCQDYSGHNNHGRNQGVDLNSSKFNGRDASIEVADAESLHFADGDFSVSAELCAQADLTDAFGDLLSKFDPVHRRGFNLTLSSNSSGYNAQSNLRQLFFGVDNATSGEWTDCGRPGDQANISDALTVYNGDLYAGTTDGADEADWAHVYRYRGGQQWEDCGRLGADRTRGVYAMVVHDGELYAATSSSHGPQPPDMSYGRVYRYLGGQTWEDVGQPGENYRLNSLASYDGKLYVAGFNIGPEPGHVYVYQGDRKWNECGEFNGWPHALAVHDGKLFAAYPQGEVYAFDGQAWQNLGNPLGSFAECNQIHSMGIYQGELYIGSWPKGKVAVLRDGKWADLGRLGDATEVIGLAVYNGCFYAGTIPRAELFRYDGPDDWSSMRRLFDPPNFEPVPVGSGAKEVQDWSRASSLAIYQGKLIVSTATCYRTKIDPPLPEDIRGKVYAFETGLCLTFDRDLGAGWKHVAAVRKGKRLELYVDGELVASSTSSHAAFDLSTGVPLRIGLGPHGHFQGQLREVRLYNRALVPHDVKQLYSNSVVGTASQKRNQ